MVCSRALRGAKPTASDGLYVGSAKYYLKPSVGLRYTKWDQTKFGIDDLRGALSSIPDKGTALGVEQAIMELNGWQGARLNKLYPVLSNMRNATNNEAYRRMGIDYLNKHFPNSTWQQLFKFE